jgi:hypothetical protein
MELAGVAVAAVEALSRLVPSCTELGCTCGRFAVRSAFAAGTASPPGFAGDVVRASRIDGKSGFEKTDANCVVDASGEMPGGTCLVGGGTT